MGTPTLSAMVDRQLAHRQHLALRDNPDWTELLRAVMELNQQRRIDAVDLQMLAGVAYTAGYWRGKGERAAELLQPM